MSILFLIKKTGLLIQFFLLKTRIKLNKVLIISNIYKSDKFFSSREEKF